MNNNRNSFFGSLIGILFGIGFFIGSFVLLWTNEGRVDLSKVAETAININGNQVDGANEGELVAVTGRIFSEERIGDDLYLKEGPYITLDRTVEMYAWVESENSDDDGDTTYSYSKEWTNNPQNSDNFARPDGHRNPILETRDQSYQVTSAQIDSFTLNPDTIFFMFPERIQLTSDLLVRERDPIQDNYIYFGNSTLANPEIGDRRVSYSAFYSDKQGTVFGRQEGSRIVTYRDEDNTILYRAYALDREGAIAALRTEFLQALWGVRAGGFAMMWFGLMLTFGPIRWILGYIPLFGRVGNFIIGVITFITAAILSLITIVISAIFHNVIALTIAVLLFLAAGYFIIRSRGQKSPEPA